MKRSEIEKDLRARGWAGPITREVAIGHGYTLIESEWPEPAADAKPADAK